MDSLERLVKSGGISYEDYRAPGPFVRRLVMEARKAGKQSEQDLASQRIRPIKQLLSGSGSLMRDALVAAQQARAAGKSQSECYAIIDRMIPSRPSYDQPRHACYACCDRGLVRVWRVDFVAFVVAGKFPIEKLSAAHTYLFACNCKAGGEYNAAKQKRLPVYSPDRHCIVSDLGIEDDRARLSEWLDKQHAAEEWKA